MGRHPYDARRNGPDGYRCWSQGLKAHSLGAFKLALHSWTDPIQRVMKKGNTLDIPIVTPRIGQPLVLKDTLEVYGNWWKQEK